VAAAVHVAIVVHVVRRIAFLSGTAGRNNGCQSSAGQHPAAGYTPLRRTPVSLGARRIPTWERCHGGILQRGVDDDSRQVLQRRASGTPATGHRIDMTGGPWHFA
jgi:hypothetical protein